MHGGATKRSKAAAAANRADAQVRAMAQTLGVPIEGDPKEFLLQEIYWSAGHVAFYRARVQALDPAALIDGTRGVSQTETSRSGELGFYETSTATETGPLVHAWLERYDTERTRLASLCATAIKIGIDERRIRLAEAQQAMLAEGFQWLVHEARLRLDLNDAEGSCLMDLVGEMMARLDRMEAGAKV